jgi:two-component system CitB family sensor kinase
MTAYTMTLKSYLTAIILLTITLIIAISGTLLVFVTKQTYLDGVSQRGIELARVLASDARVINAVHNPSSDSERQIQDYIEAIRAKTDASYIVVTDKNATRLSHPTPERIGKTFIGDDIYPTLNEGVTRTTVDTGSLGSAIRNFAPILAPTLSGAETETPKVIGAVSIGYLEQSITDLLFKYYAQAVLWLGVIYILAIVLTLSLLSKLKRTFLAYEPEEIVQRFKEHSLLLDGIREGIIALDRHHRITAINSAASNWLAPDQNHASLIGLPLNECSQSLSLLIVESLDNRHRHSITLGHHTFAVTLYPLSSQGNSGYLIVLNHEQDMSDLEQALARTTAYAQQLRSKTHEHFNKLNVISGLLQAGKTQSAVEYLQKESDQHQHMLGTLIKRIENSPVAGMLLAKYNFAQEKHIEFTLDEDSQLSDYPPAANDDLITVIGNLVENAFEAALANPSIAPSVNVYVSDRNKHLMLSVEDSGLGVNEKIAQRIYDLGVSGKEAHTEHGVGLYLVSRIAHRYNGTIDWERTGQSTVFSVYLDKQELQP